MFWRTQKLFRQIRKLVPISTQSVVLDIGGGSGKLAKYFVSQANQVIVVDPSEKAIKQCEQRRGVICKFGSAEQLPIEDNSIDLVIISYAFHHIGDQAKALTEIRRVLKPQGQLLIRDFDPRHWLTKWLTRLETAIEHGCIFHSAPALRALVEQNEFRAEIVTKPNKGQYFLLANKV